ncbi:MAG TPA: SDR family NAD(P)-dependent oxidoreductase [Solirubrobacterales bacterium]
MSDRMAGKNGIVTGGARGIGRELAGAFAAAGARVAIWDTDGEAARAAATEIGAGAIAAAVDVTDESAVATAVEAVLGAYGNVDFLINNAGIRHVAPIAEESVDAWRRTIDVNVNGTFICSQAVIGAMVAAGGGQIVNLASMAGELALRERAAYNTSKAAIVGLTKSIAIEVGGAGVRCNAIAPGVIETPLSAPYFEDEAMVAVLRENSPMDRWGQVGEIAGPALFLCSEDSSFVNGATLFVDGGWTAGKGY